MYDDPMRIDEAEFRAVEAAVLTDLLARGVDDDKIGIEAIRTAHLVPIRIEEVPRPHLHKLHGIIDRSEYRRHLLESAMAMKTAYERANEKLRQDPTTRPTMMLADLIVKIEDTLGELQDPTRTVKGLKLATE